MARTGRHDVDDEPLPPSRPFLIALVLILVALAVMVAWHYLGAIVFALLFGFLLQPAQRGLTKLVRWPWLAATILTLGVGVLLVAPFVLIAWSVYDEFLALLALLQDPAALHEKMNELLAPFGLDVEEVAPRALEFGRSAASGAAGLVLPTARFVFDFMISLIVFFFLTFFAIRDGSKWGEALRDRLPLPAGDKDRLFDGASASIKAITMGTFFVAGVQGVVAGIGWWLFGFPSPLFWGAVMVVVGILPFGAPFLITVPAGIIAMVMGDWFAGIGIIVYTVTLVALTDDVLRPIVVGKGASVHPGAVLIGMLGGIYVFGVAGFLIGPLIFALLGPVVDVWAHRRRHYYEDADNQDAAIRGGV